MTPRSLFLCLAGSVALHAPFGLALAGGHRDPVVETTTRDAWTGGGGEPVQLVDDANDPPQATEATAAATAAAPPGAGADTHAAEPTSAAPAAPPKKPRKARPKRPSGATGTTAPSSAPVAQGPGPEGLGDQPRGDARDLLRAFTRAISPANQADAAWSQLSAGQTLDADVSFDIDTDGHVTSSDAAPGAPARISELVRRTTFLLKGSTFAPRPGGTTAGRRTFHVHVRVTDTGLADVEGGTVELSFDVKSGVGHAWFLRPAGRRVDVEIRPARD